MFVDTYVWISAFINADGPPARVLDAFIQARFIPVVSETLLREIRAVAKRPRIRRRCRFHDDALETLLTLLRDRAIEAFPTGHLRMCRDPNDDALLETAVLGGAQFAVSRDDDIKRDPPLIACLRQQGVEVLSVAQFLRWLTADRDDEPSAD
ncbi:MAG TPA: putative toxin-antitoxin system toxin component, PIN family [Chloroflexota bacterium]|nr:putative toxin-antitoxin system toxin component, PIN family [Chloroflexota bacterium]